MLQAYLNAFPNFCVYFSGKHVQGLLPAVLLQRLWRVSDASRARAPGPSSPRLLLLLVWDHVMTWTATSSSARKQIEVKLPPILWVFALMECKWPIYTRAPFPLLSSCCKNLIFILMILKRQIFEKKCKTKRNWFWSQIAWKLVIRTAWRTGSRKSISPICYFPNTLRT